MGGRITFLLILTGIVAAAALAVTVVIVAAGGPSWSDPAPPAAPQRVAQADPPEPAAPTAPPAPRPAKKKAAPPPQPKPSPPDRMRPQVVDEREAEREAAEARMSRDAEKQLKVNLRQSREWATTILRVRGEQLEDAGPLLDAVWRADLEWNSKVWPRMESTKSMIRKAARDDHLSAEEADAWWQEAEDAIIEESQPLLEQARADAAEAVDQLRRILDADQVERLDNHMNQNLLADPPSLFRRTRLNGQKR